MLLALKFLAILVFLVVVNFGAYQTLPAVSTGGEDSDTSLIPIHVEHFNDFHARFEQTSLKSKDCNPGGKCVGGFSRLFAEVKRQKPDLLFFAGDAFQGSLWYTLFKWNVTSQFFNMLHQDAMTLGNHEFDDGLAGLIPYIESSRNQIIVSNIDATDEPEFKKLQDSGKIRPSKIFNVKGVRIGVIGVVTTTTAEKAPVGKLKFLDEIESIERELNRIKNECDSILILSHCGLDVERKFAAKLNGKIDLIIGGHSHTLMYNGVAPNGKPTDPYPVIVTNEIYNNSVLIVQAYKHTQYLGDITLFFNRKTKQLVKWNATNPIYLDEMTRGDDNAAQAMKPWIEKIYKITHEVIALNEIELSVDSCYYSECSIGDFMADALVNEYVNHKEPKWANLTAAVINTGSTKTTFSVGNVTYGDVLKSQPFKNTIDAIEIRGSKLRAAFQTMCRVSDESWRRFLQISGLQVVFNSINVNITTYDGSCYELTSLKIRKSLGSDDYEEVLNDKYYRLAMPSFLANGGDGYSTFGNTTRFTGSVDREVFTKFFKKSSPVHQVTDGRILITK